MNDRRRQQEEAEELAVRDDPDAFSALKSRRAVERKEAELRRREEANAAETERLEELRRTVNMTSAERLASTIKFFY